MGGAVGFNLVTFPKILSMPKPFLTPTFHVPQNNSNITTQLIIGSGIFGVGWGMLGICPGPGMTALAAGVEVFPWIVGMFSGSLVHIYGLKWKASS